MIKREIERAIELNDLGDECDKQVWMAIKEIYDGH